MYNRTMQGLERGLTYGLSCLGSLVLLGAFASLIIERKISPTRSTPIELIPEVLDKMNLKKTDKFVDLGSGDGTFIIEVTRKFRVKSTAFDISPMHIIYSKFKTFFINLFKREGLKIDIFAENFLTLDESILIDFDVFYLNQPKKILEYFEPKAKLLSEKGLKFFTLNSSFPNLKPIKEYKLSKGATLYEY